MANIDLEKEYDKILGEKSKKAQTTETQRPEKVVKGGVRRQKPTASESFYSQHVSPLCQLILQEYIIPAAKDAVLSCVEIVLYGESKKNRKKGGSRIDYSAYSSSRESKRTVSRRDRATHNFDTISFDSKGDADAVLDQMLFLCDKFGAATVADFYDLVGVEQTSADQDYGWVDLRSARVRHTRYGWILDMDRPYFLD